MDKYEDRIRNMNHSIDSSRNEMILLNIVRARYQHPLTFVSTTSVLGGQTTGGTLGLPTITLGPDRTSLQRQTVFGGNSVNASGSSNVNLVPLESKEFYQGLLLPLSLKTVQFFVSQGYPRQVLFYLLIESVRIKGKTRDTLIWNDPADPTFSKFSEFVQQAAISGLSIETRAGSAHICFDSGLASIPLVGFTPICGRTTGQESRVMGVFGGQFGRAPVQIQFRSTYGVFRYLGKLTDPELGSRVQLVSRHVGGTALNDDTRLFPVEHGLLNSNCLTSVEYQGDITCIPAAGGEQGPLILQLLAQLLALNVSLRDLPIIQSVRIAN